MAQIDHISWEEADRLSRELAAQIKEPFDVVVCILRGGAIPGVIIANELGIDCVLGVKVQQQGQETAVLDTSGPGGAVPYKGLAGQILVPLNDYPLAGKKVLVVDDVLDSGESARLIMDHVRDQHPALVQLATLHIKTYSTFVSDYYCEAKTNWLFYPWMSAAELESMHERLALAEAQREFSA